MRLGKPHQLGAFFPQKLIEFLEGNVAEAALRSKIANYLTELGVTPTTVDVEAPGKASLVLQAFYESPNVVIVDRIAIEPAPAAVLGGEGKIIAILLAGNPHPRNPLDCIGGTDG